MQIRQDQQNLPASILTRLKDNTFKIAYAILKDKKDSSTFLCCLIILSFLQIISYLISSLVF